MKLALGTKVALAVLAVFDIFVMVMAHAGFAGEDTSVAAGMTGVVGLLTFALGGGIIWLWRRSVPQPLQRHPERDRYCTRCGTVAEYRRFRVGSDFVCFALFLVGILPGVIYYVWAKSAEYHGCRRCGAREIVPVNSPVAKRALEAAQEVNA